MSKQTCLRYTFLFTALVSTSVAACNLDWTVHPTMSDDAGALPVSVSALADAEAPLATSERVDAAPVSDVPDAVSDAGVDASDAEADASPDASSSDDVCGPKRPCAGTAVCTYDDHYCGSGLTSGHCVARPTSCADAALEPVCGCGGTTYTSPCAAAMSGADVSLQACPTTPPNAFACGYLYCQTNEPCLITGSGASTTYQCGSSGSCSLCLCALGCAGGSCGNENGHVVLRCP